jgi:hypothetical protein
MHPWLIAIGASGVLGVAAFDLVKGLRTGAMRTMAAFSPTADRAQKPALYWTFAAMNVGAMLAMLLVVADALARKPAF